MFLVENLEEGMWGKLSEKISFLERNAWSLLKACDAILVSVPRFMTKCYRGGGANQSQNRVTSFMNEPTNTLLWLRQQFYLIIGLFDIIS